MPWLPLRSRGALFDTRIAYQRRIRHHGAVAAPGEIIAKWRQRIESKACDAGYRHHGGKQ